MSFCNFNYNLFAKPRSMQHQYLSIILSILKNNRNQWNTSWFQCYSIILTTIDFKPMCLFKKIVPQTVCFSSMFQIDVEIKKKKRERNVVLVLHVGSPHPDWHPSKQRPVTLSHSMGTLQCRLQLYRQPSPNTPRGQPCRKDLKY